MADAVNKTDKVNARNPERVTINPDTLARLNAWVSELEARRIAVTRNQLVNWLLCRRDTTLTSPELRELESAFFDEVRYAEWALRELKAAQRRGDSVTLAEILARHRPSPKTERRDGAARAKSSRIINKSSAVNDQPSPTDTSVSSKETLNFIDKTEVT